MKVQSVEKLQERFKSINRGRLSWVVAIEISAILVAASFFLPGGDDLLHYYLPYAKG
jgi:hypothetical protein